MVSGELDRVEEVSGQGIPAWGYALGGPKVGSGPGAVTRGAMWLNLPRAGTRVERLLLSIGIFTDREVRTPISWKLVVDGVSISREFRPHFVVETDDGYYMKAIYDVKPVLAGRVLRQESHKILVYRDAVHPIRVADALLYARFENEKARYAVSYYTGAVALEPGEYYKVDADIGRSFGGKRTAGVILHSPYHDSAFELIAGGSRPERAVGHGVHYIEVTVPYKGSPVPVSLRYVDPGFKFYPRIAVLTEVIATELLAPAPEPKLVIESVEASDTRVRVKGIVENVGDDVLDSTMLVVLALGARLARKTLPPVDPGKSIDFSLEFDISRLPIRPSRASIRLIWRRLGETRLVSEEVQIPS